MKSILVIETPLCCEDCPCSTIVKAPQINGCWSANCELCGKFNDKIMTKPEWCPLKPMPSKFDLNYDRTKKDTSYNRAVYREHIGWNACIDELEK